MSKKKRTVIQVHVTPSQSERLKKAAEADGRSLSGFIRHAAEQQAAKHEKDNGQK